MKRNRVVRQRHEWGCGIACVASVLGISYNDAKSRLESYEEDGELKDWESTGLEPDTMIKVLADAGIIVEERVGLRRWPSGTIVFLSEEWGRYKESGHYMVKTDEGWMDPWINGPDEKPRKADIRDRLPYGTSVQVALVPVA